MRPLARSADPRVVSTRARVLEATMDLLVELGIRRITMTAIVERSGVSKATFYRHWTSLEDVVYDAVAAGIWPPGEATLDPPTSDQLHEAADAVASHTAVFPVRQVLPGTPSHRPGLPPPR